MIMSCTSDEFEESGICVTCTRAATADLPALDVMACSNGDGTITVTLDGASTTSENDTETFRITQEASGATCN